MTQGRIEHYPEFWRHYLREHARPATRGWHYLGSSLGLLCLLAAAILRQPWLLVAAVLFGYGPAWLGHFAYERNRPATFQYPLWSLYSDFRMLAAWLSGSLPRELDEAGIRAHKKGAGTP